MKLADLLLAAQNQTAVPVSKIKARIKELEGFVKAGSIYYDVAIINPVIAELENLLPKMNNNTRKEEIEKQ